MRTQATGCAVLRSCPSRLHVIRLDVLSRLVFEGPAIEVLPLVHLGIFSSARIGSLRSNPSSPARWKPLARTLVG